MYTTPSSTQHASSLQTVRLMLTNSSPPLPPSTCCMPSGHVYFDLSVLLFKSRCHKSRSMLDWCSEVSSATRRLVPHCWAHTPCLTTYDSMQFPLHTHELAALQRSTSTSTQLRINAALSPLVHSSHVHRHHSLVPGEGAVLSEKVLAASAADLHRLTLVQRLQALVCITIRL